MFSKLSKYVRAHRRNQKAMRRYKSDLKEWIKQGGIVSHHWPIIDEYDATAANLTPHYFHQDLLVAQLILQDAPHSHLDIGSRIDGFVANVAVFREIEVIDIRPMAPIGHPNIRFRQQDFFDASVDEITDSLSCLHAVEHFGLGRYGDKIDVGGFEKAISRMCQMVRPAGRFYVSFPIGQGNEVHFNAHRVMHPEYLLKLPDLAKSMRLERFDFVDDLGKLHRDVSVSEAVGNTKHGCGIYTFRKVGDSS